LISPRIIKNLSAISATSAVNINLTVTLEDFEKVVKKIIPEYKKLCVLRVLCGNKTLFGVLDHLVRFAGQSERDLILM
jgi:hypothetical protein